MSFLDDVLNVGSSVWSWATGSSNSAALARAAALGLLLNQITNSISKDTKVSKSTTNKNTSGGTTTVTPNQAVDPGVRLQLSPDTNHSIPVVYGSAYLSGIVTDAFLTPDNKTMWYCITICEKTGKTLDGVQSQITISNIYWGDEELKLKPDGVNAASLIDASGNINYNVDGLVSFYCYSGGSNYPVKFDGYARGVSQPANTVFPNWTIQHTMNDLVFVLVKIDYNKEQNIVGLPEITFKVNNTMKQPGDVLYDYMTNRRYGAGIPKDEIYYV